MSYQSDVVLSIHEDVLTDEIRDLLEYWAETKLWHGRWTLFHMPWVTWDDVMGEGKKVIDHLKTIEDSSQFYFLRLGEDFGDIEDLGEGRFNKEMPFYVNYNAHLDYGINENAINVEKLIALLNTAKEEAESGNLEPLLIIHDFMKKIDPKVFAHS